MTLWERDYFPESNAVQIEEEFNPDPLILLVFGDGNINLPGQVISTGAKNFSENSLPPLCLKGHNDFFDGPRTSPPVPFGPPTLTLPLGGGKV